MIRLRHFGRQEFLDEVWDYQRGEHTTIIGRTGSGKSTLGYQLLGASASPELPGVTIVSKPKDKTSDLARRRMRHRLVRGWPPLWSLWRPNDPPGWMVWPRHTLDPDIDDPRHFRAFRSTIRGAYKEGDRILYVPDLYGMLRFHGELTRDFEQAWVNGRAMGLGFWTDTQKPSHIPLLAYNQATHLFLARDADKRNRARFSEIGGMDGQVIAKANLELAEHAFLYIRATDQTMCVIDP